MAGVSFIPGIEHKLTLVQSRTVGNRTLLVGRDSRGAQVLYKMFTDPAYVEAAPERFESVNWSMARRPLFRVIGRDKGRRSLIFDCRYEFDETSNKKEGGFGAVFLTRDKMTKRFCAVKFFHPTRATQAESEVMLTLSLWKKGKLTHRNIIGMVEIYREEGDTMHPTAGALNGFLPSCIVAEYALMGEMLGFVSIPDPRDPTMLMPKALPERIARFLMLQAASAVAFLHQHNVIHRDVKMENFLMTLEPSPTRKRRDGTPLPDIIVKLCDFGFAKEMLQVDGRPMSRTTSYKIPDKLLEDPAIGGGRAKDGYMGSAVDVWLFGNMLFMATLGNFPLNSGTADGPGWLAESLDSESGNAELWEHWAMYGVEPEPELKDLLNKTLCMPESDRISIKEVLAHPWMNRPSATHDEVLKELAERDPMFVEDALEKYYAMHGTPAPMGGVSEGKSSGGGGGGGGGGGAADETVRAMGAMSLDDESKK